jgi:hypothetical protein
MTTSPRPPIKMRGRARDISGFAMLAALLLGGCVTNGDFDRVRPELVYDHMHDWVGAAAIAGTGESPSIFRLTDDERTLRDLAYALIEPPYKRGRWDSVWREYGYGRVPPDAEPPFDRSKYFIKLHHAYRRSEASAYAQVVTDARNDVERLPEFFSVANRVLDMDHKRTVALAHVSVPGPIDAQDVHRRKLENRAIVAWVCRALKQRGSSYRFALERLVIIVPSPGAADTERAIDMLHTRIGGYCGSRAVVAAKG